VLHAISRLFVGAVIWFGLVILAFLSGFFVGGGKGLFELAHAAVFVIPLWAIWPVVKSIYLLIDRKSSD
jgi:hypothetical protein